MRTLWPSAVLLTSLVALGFGANAQTANSPLPNLPPALGADDLKPYLAVYAKGVQIYVCNKVDGTNWTWTFKSPEA